MRERYGGGGGGGCCCHHKASVQCQGQHEGLAQAPGVLPATNIR